MADEMFTNGGADGGKLWNYRPMLTADNVKPGDQTVAIVKFCHAAKWSCKILTVLLFVYTIIMITNAVPVMWKAWRKLVKGDLSAFSQKEGLQYLGASADIIRGDLENSQDSLAEKALAAQMRVTNMPAPKATFLERVTNKPLTPEEELAASMRK
jgi:hypothetical protein